VVVATSSIAVGLTDIDLCSVAVGSVPAAWCSTIAESAAAVSYYMMIAASELSGIRGAALQPLPASSLNTPLYP
jgi:hypothetical protein